MPGGVPLPPYVSLIHDVLHRRPVAVHPQRRAGRGLARVAPLLENPPAVQLYPQGSWGPEAAELVGPGGWHLQR